MRLGDFDFYKDFFLEKTGMELSQDKSYLLDSRLPPIAHKWGHHSLETMTMIMRGVPNAAMVQDILESLADDETWFFRDLYPFYHFRDTALPMIMKARPRKDLRIWCAGCSTGQEPYSIAMALKEIPQKQGGWKFEFLATDFSEQLIDKAKIADYSQTDVQRGLSIHLLLKYFDQKDTRWRLKKDVKSMVNFLPFNLLDVPKRLGTFDIIFCRNVLTGMDPVIRPRILQNLAGALAPDGVLYVGIDETLDNTGGLFAPMPGTQGVFTRSA